jgi:hypothetical protein
VLQLFSKKCVVSNAAFIEEVTGSCGAQCVHTSVVHCPMEHSVIKNGSHMHKVRRIFVVDDEPIIASTLKTYST